LFWEFSLIQSHRPLFLKDDEYGRNQPSKYEQENGIPQINKLPEKCQEHLNERQRVNPMELLA